MITVSNPDEILKAYSNWLRIDEGKFWLIGNQTKPFVEKHVEPLKGLRHYENAYMDVYQIPLSITYPSHKRDAGVVLTKNTLWVLTRNMKLDLQPWVMDYIRTLYPESKLEKGLKHTSNDIYLNGKKVFGELGFTKCGYNYYACMINLELTDGDKEDIVNGLSEDKNFFPQKIVNISGIKNQIPAFDPNEFVEELEEYIYGLAKISEYSKY